MTNKTDLRELGDAGCAANEPFALRVLGDSMEPEFPDGCIVIVEPQERAKNGAYVLAEIDGEYVFRQLVITGERHFLRPLSPGYPTVEITGIRAIKGLIIQRSGVRRRDRKLYI